MAPNGPNSMHNDAYATDAYAGGGPLGARPQVTSATYGVDECATMAFDRAGRIVGLCGGARGLPLMLIDPDTLDVARRRMPTSDARRRRTGANPLDDLCGGAYFYLDDRDRAIVETTDAHDPGRREVDRGRRSTCGATTTLAAAIPEGDCLIALMPDWDGRIWFVTQKGGVGTVDPRPARGAHRSG